MNGLERAARELIAAQDSYDEIDAEAFRAVFHDDPDCDDHLAAMEAAAERLDEAWAALRRELGLAPADDSEGG